MNSHVRDIAARIAATAITEVLKELSISHQVAGVAVFPSGELSYLVDIVMLDLTTQRSWAVSFTVPISFQEKEHAS